MNLTRKIKAIMKNNYNYYEIKPNEVLSKCIKEYWVIENVKNDAVIEVFPDGCFDIVIYINKHTKNTVFISGIWSKKITVNVYQDTDVMGVRFYPAGIDLIFDINVSALKNIKQIFADNMLKKSDQIDLAILYHSKDIDAIIDFYNFYFEYIIENENYSSVFDYISRLSEKCTVSEFSKTIGMSERQLLREYRNKLGITTKNYLSIIRFIKAKNMLLNGVNYSDIVFECVYTDESHFIREFKKYTSYTPKDFLIMSDLYN